MLEKRWRNPEINLEEKILSLLKQKPSITIKEVAKAINQIRGSVEYKINSLKTKGLIERIGPTKGGHWRTLPKTN